MLWPNCSKLLIVFAILTAIQIEANHHNGTRIFEATFRGQEFLQFTYNRTLEPVISQFEELSLYFKTRSPNGLLYYSSNENGDQYINLALKDGAVILLIDSGTTVLDATVRPNRIRFDDNQWHKVLLHRRVQEITKVTSFCHFSITVDGVYTERGSTTGSFGLINTALMFVAGTDGRRAHIGGRAQPNLVGCLRNAELSTDTLELNLIDLQASKGHGHRFVAEAFGQIVPMCQEVEVADPITFTTADSFLELPQWDAPRQSSISLKLRTNEPSGVLLYSSGQSNGDDQPQDFLAFELLDGHLFMLINMGSGPVKVKATTRRVDDGQWHSLSLRRNGKSGRVTVDESAADFIAPGQSSQLDLEGPLFLGALGPSVISPTHRLPPELWSGSLGFGFVGCVRDLVLDNEPVDIAEVARRQDSGGVRPACHTTQGHCQIDACLNGGHCVEGWNRHSCDCSRTGFSGPNCGKETTTLSFNGHQFMQVGLDHEQLTQAEDVHIRFRTSRPSGLLVLTQSRSRPQHHLMISLDQGRAKVTVNMGEGNKVVHVGRDLNDDQWHSVKVERRGPSLDIKLDGVTQMAEIKGQLILLQISSINLGATDRDHLKSGWPTLFQSIKDIPNFVGLMQHFIFNRKNYFEMARHGQLTSFNITADFGKKDRVITHAVTFKSRQTFVGLPQLKAYSTLNIHFQFKTLISNGLLFYNGGKGQDFIAIELVGGHLNYLFNLGDGPRRVRSSTRNVLNDNKWHSVTISRPSIEQHTLMVDDLLATLTTSSQNVHLDLDGLLYLGGVRRSMYESLPKIISSKHGYEGCLASIDLNGELIDPTGIDTVIPSTLVEPGCTDSRSRCTSSACSNRGICVQMWNTFACDCDMTSYTGPTCDEEATAYRFGSSGGLVTFNYPPDKRLDSKSDLLALGFITEMSNAILVRVDSSTSNDYLELQLVDGLLLMVYNLGYEDHAIGELDIKVNDGRYHVVRFTRSGPNATIQLDNHNVISRYPTGKQLTIFNTVSKVQVGGKRSIGGERELERPFIGIISGLSLNGEKILDAAAESDPRIIIEGQVELLVQIPTRPPAGSSVSTMSSHRNGTRKLKPHQIMQQHAKGQNPLYEGDELILSGDGSGCWDDEDCVSLMGPAKGGDNTGGVPGRPSTDDLITPIILVAPPTAPPSHGSGHRRPHIPLSSHCIDDPDDPDCNDLEGSGEIDEDEDDDSDFNAKGPVFFPVPNHRPITPVPPTYHYNAHTQRTTSTTEFEDNSILYTFKPIPPPEPPPVQTYRPPKPTRPTGPPIIVDVPKPQSPTRDISALGPSKTGVTSVYTNKTSADQTALTIGLVAVLIIVIVVVAPVILFMRARSRHNPLIGTNVLTVQGHATQPLMNSSKSVRFADGGPIGVTPPPTQVLGVYGASGLGPGLPDGVTSTLGQGADLKEWYV